MSIFKTKTRLGKYKANIESALSELADNHIITRIWQHDHTVWKSEPKEITNRLGWLDIAERLEDEIGRLTALKDQLLIEGYTDVLLLGMGGSSLAPEVFAKTFGHEVTGLNLSILDSTDPGAVKTHTEQLDLHKTLFIIATKSGTTVETLSFFRYFYNRVQAEVGEDQVGSHFMAITDPGSKLQTLATNLNFREIFTNDPNIGGRFSVMSFFGLVPAALVGLDLVRLIERTKRMAQACGSQVPVTQNPGALLGAAMGILNRAGRDKVTFISSREITSFGDWVEQLIAESTGKEGKGILPVVRENLGEPEVYGNDRIFVHLSLKDDAEEPKMMNKLAEAGHPLLHLQLADKYDLGAQFFLWEFATAISGYFLRINPFNQPNVESAKIQARNMVSKYTETGKLPEADYAPLNAKSLDLFLADSAPGSYASIQAYVTPTPAVEAKLSELRHHVRDVYKLATTLGFGPRFLHSTGQLHKGDAGHGLFIQITSETEIDIPIPDQAGKTSSTMTFQTLKTAQALGDAAALKDAGRRLIRFKINHIEELGRLIETK